DRAAAIVVQRFKAAGLQPAGDGGGWFQVFPVHEARVEKQGTSIGYANGDLFVPLDFLKQVTVRPTDDLPASVSAPVTFRGYCAPADLKNVAGTAVICFNTKRAGLPSAGQRVEAAG